ncbi:MAG: transposase [Halieaceae bacterium]
MARKQRLYFAGCSYHLVHRGVNGTPIFYEPSDFIRYQDYLLDAMLRYGVLCHAYVQMTNHVHLLLSPSCNEGISRVMCLVGNRYVKAFNRTHERTGTLWEGRHYSCAIHTDRYLWACYRYIEMNPVRAGLSSAAAGYYWSSYACNALGASNELITPHPVWNGLGNSSEHRCDAYKRLFDANRRADNFDEIRHATRSGLAVDPSPGPLKPPGVPATAIQERSARIYH